MATRVTELSRPPWTVDIAKGRPRSYCPCGSSVCLHVDESLGVSFLTISQEIFKGNPSTNMAGAAGSAYFLTGLATSSGGYGSRSGFGLGETKSPIMVWPLLPQKMELPH